MPIGPIRLPAEQGAARRGGPRIAKRRAGPRGSRGTDAERCGTMPHHNTQKAGRRPAHRLTHYTRQDAAFRACLVRARLGARGPRAEPAASRLRPVE